MLSSITKKVLVLWPTDCFRLHTEPVTFSFLHYLPLVRISLAMPVALPSPWISGLRRWAFPLHLLIIASVSSMFPFHNAARWRPYPLKLFHRVAGQQFQTSGGTCSSRSFSGSRVSDLPWGYPLLPYFTDLLRSVIILSDWNSTNSHV